MNKIEILSVLDEAYYSTFLDSIELIKSWEKEYRLSDYYKTTRIPLMELYKNYFNYQKANNSLMEQMNEWLETLDEERISNKIVEIITKLTNSETIQTLLKNFSLEELEKQRDELGETIKTLK